MPPPAPRLAAHAWRASRPLLLAVAAVTLGFLLHGCQTSSSNEPPATAAHAPPVANDAAADNHETEADDGDETLTLAEFNDRWTRMLRPAVDRRTGGVDYRKFHAEREALAELRDALAARRHFRNDDEQLAFLLNAYNLLVIATVVEYPRLPATVRDIDGFFIEPRHRLLGDRYSLDDIRDRLIRPLAHPRAHFALVNGAIGGPLMLHVAYTARELDAQLDYQHARFLTDPVRNTVIGPTLMLSPLFRWFRDDFEAAAADGTLAGYLRGHAPEDSPIAAQLAREPDSPIEFLDFNWALNHVPTPDTPPGQPEE